MQLDYITVLRATRLLAAAAYDLKLQDEVELDVGGLRQVTLLDGPGSFLEEATETLLRMVDALNYDDIVGDGQLTGPAMNVAMLEGWCMLENMSDPNGTLIIIPDEDDRSERFDNAASAHLFVEDKARSGKPGTKLHRIALSLVDPDFPVRFVPLG